jgi:hypothetical protein
LRSLTNLKTLYIGRNNLTQEQIDELRQALPNTDIWFD